MSTDHVVVIGGGVYGCFIAEYTANMGCVTTLIEKEPDLLQRASQVNQARVHRGYHYPRSILTASSSTRNYDRFISDFGDAINKSDQNYYAIAKANSKVSASQFKRFCAHVGIPCTTEDGEVASLFSNRLIESVFSVKETTFDCVILREILRDRLIKAGVEIKLGCEATHIDSDEKKGEASIIQEGKVSSICFDHLYNCTYSNLNHILKPLPIQPIPLKFELTELALMTPPDSLPEASITVMDGPFFSLMPYPSKKLSSLTHVRYTPHENWDSNTSHSIKAPHPPLHSNSQKMIRDASRYMPILSELRHEESLWEIKAILPQNAKDDGRPILLHQSEGHPNIRSILGGKIDIVSDLEDELLKIHKRTK